MSRRVQQSKGRRKGRECQCSVTFDDLPRAVVCATLAFLRLRDFMRMRCVSTILCELTQRPPSAPRKASLVVCAPTLDRNVTWVTRHDALRGISKVRVHHLTLMLPVARSVNIQYGSRLHQHRHQHSAPWVDVPLLVTCVAHMHWIESLTLQISSGKPDCLTSLASLTCLQTLDLRMQRKDTSLGWLHVLTTLQTLRLVWDQAVGAERLPPLLPHICNLSRLSALTLDGAESCDLVLPDSSFYKISETDHEVKEDERHDHRQRIQRLPVNVRALALRDMSLYIMQPVVPLLEGGKQLYDALDHLDLCTFEVTRRCTVTFVSALTRAHPNLKNVQCERIADDEYEGDGGGGGGWKYAKSIGKDGERKTSAKIVVFHVDYCARRLFQQMELSYLHTLHVGFMSSEHATRITLPSLHTLVVAVWDEESTSVMTCIDAPRLKNMRVSNQYVVRPLTTLEWMSAFPTLETCVLHNLQAIPNMRLPTLSVATLGHTPNSDIARRPVSPLPGYEKYVDNLSKFEAL